MPLLSPSSVHIDQPLTNLTLAYVQSQDAFIADKVFPVVGVDKQSDKYYKYDRAEMNRTGNVKALAPRTEVERIGMSVSSDSYFADVYGLGMDFDEQTLANEDAALDIRSAGAQTLTGQLLVHREKQFADTFFKADVWGTTTTPSTLWSAASGATPIKNVTDAARTIQLKSGGFRPNTMVVGRNVHDALINHADILKRIGLEAGGSTANPALATRAMLARIFEVENYYVMEAVQNDRNEDLGTETDANEFNSFIGGNHAMLCYTPSAAGTMSPAAGLTFAWNNLPGVNNLGITVESFTDDALKRQQIAEMIQVKMSYDMKIVGSELGYFFEDVVA